MEDEGWDGSIQADAFVEILLRIPPSARRRLRLVCRHWRDVVDEHLPARRRAHSKVLAYVSRRRLHHTPRIYVFYDLTEGRSRELDLLRSKVGGCAFHMIGTCNGLLCLCCYYKTGIVLFNPTTGEKLVVELPTFRLPQQRHADYSFFTFHPATGLYKIVLVVQGNDENSLDEVQVFTLGGTSWRKVPSAPGSSCKFSSGFVSIYGVMYWVAEDTMSVMSLDLKDECVTALPVRAPLLDDTCRLTDVEGLLGFTNCMCKPSSLTKTTETSGCVRKRPQEPTKLILPLFTSHELAIVSGKFPVLALFTSSACQLLLGGEFREGLLHLSSPKSASSRAHDVNDNAFHVDHEAIFFAETCPRPDIRALHFN
ncbi:hypothetical protein QOZ80_8AG0635480 [Eleusine coracana subsp. coracana]|nr:hypothetical protein QOZ80_8AG0635480 [Eleusine coracana subsp. coracana]